MKTVLKSLKITFVIFLQGMLAQLLSAVASFLVRGTNPASQAAVAVSNKIFFILSLFILGISNGAAVLVSHYWGKADYAGVKKTLGMTLILSGLASLFFSLLCVRWSPEIVAMFMHEDSERILAAEYLSLLAPSFVFYGLCQTYALFYRAVGKGPVMLKITGAITLFNIVLDLILLKGIGRIPGMGILGIARAVLITRILEFAIIIFDVYRQPGPGRASLKELLAFDIVFLKSYFKRVSPIILDMSIVSAGNFVFSTAYANMSSLVVITMSVFHPLEQIVFAFINGASSAAAVIMGHTMGACRMEDAKRYSRNYLLSYFFGSLFLAVGIFLAAGPASYLFTATESIAADVKECLYILCAFIPMKLINDTIAEGFLKSGGDAGFNALNHFMGFAFCLPFCLMGITVGLPAHWVYLLFMTGELLKLGFNLYRYFSKKWLRTLAE